MMSIHFSHLAHENLPYKPAKLIKADDNVIVIINHESISTNSVNSWCVIDGHCHTLFVGLFMLTSSQEELKIT